MELENFNDHIAKGIAIRSRAKLVDEDEKCTRFFMQQEVRNNKTKHIKCLNIANSVIKDPDLIMREQEHFYRDLYSEKERPNKCIGECQLFNNNIPQLNENDKDFCDKKITIEELGKSLKALPNNKSPGSDGLTTEFYKFFWPDIKRYVFDSFQYAFTTGRLSRDQRRAVLTLLPKQNKDPRHLKNWRPLSVLNTDYKILTKTLADRLQKVLPSIISNDQVGYIKGRYIGENLRTILDIFEFTTTKTNPGIAVFLDFEKAFDTISWKFMFKALGNFNFGDNFIKWVNVLYSEPLCCVTNNGYSSNFFATSRGIRQGCPISALLFIIVAEIMSITIRNNDKIHGLMFGGHETTLTQLADDTTLFLKDTDSLQEAFNILEHFYICSGLKLNKDKTEAIKLGIDNIDSTKFGIKWIRGPIKVLGIWIGKNLDEIRQKNFEEKLHKIQHLVNMWRSRHLSIKGKITLLKSQALPLILYPASVLFIPEEVVKELDEIFFGFIWPRKKHHVKRDVLIQSIEEGGLKMPDIKLMVKSMKVTWIKRLIGDNNFSKVASSITKISNFNEFLSFKNDVRFISQDIPPFYKQIFEYWFELYSVHPVSTNDILNEKIWNNKYILINEKPICYKTWQQQGITIINHIVTENGDFYDRDELARIYNIQVDIMAYNSLKSSIPQLWRKQIKNPTTFVENPHENQLFLYVNKIEKPLQVLKCKDFYKEYLQKKSIKPKCISKWEEHYCYVDFDWKNIFTLPYTVARETSLQSLQYQIINRFIPCKYMLKIWNKEESDLCQFCHETDTIEHLFVKCQKVVPFWKSFNQWFQNTTGTHIILHTLDILFGIINDNKDDMLCALNFCLLFAKSFIYECYKTNKECSFELFTHRLKSRLDSECVIMKLKGIENTFQIKWSHIYETL